VELHLVHSVNVVHCEHAYLVLQLRHRVLSVAFGVPNPGRHSAHVFGVPVALLPGTHVVQSGMVQLPAAAVVPAVPAVAAVVPAAAVVAPDAAVAGAVVTVPFGGATVVGFGAQLWVSFI
jgi:hypothetical protein